MIGDFGEVLVMDWGLSKETGFAGETEEVLSAAPSSDGAEWRTMEGSVLGTPTYMSPEQARGEVDAVDARSDIYCLGAIMHEILYLQPPVDGGSALEIVEKVGRGELDPPPKVVRPHWPGGRVPASLEAVRGKAMAFDPARRYPSVPDLQSDIVAYQSGFATSAEAASVATQAVLFFKRNRGVSISVLGGLALLAALSSLFIWSLQHQLAEKEVLLGERNTALTEKEGALVLAEEKTKEAEDNARQSAESERLAEKRLADFRRERDRADSLDSEKKTIQTEAESERGAVAKRSFKDAQEAVRAGNLDKAMRDINLAIERSPAEAYYLVLRANLLQSSGQLGLAADNYRKAIELGARDSAETNLDLSEKLASQQGLGNGVSAEVHRELSKALVNQGRNQELPFLDAALKASSVPSKESQLAQVAAAEIPVPLTELPGWSDERFEIRPDGKVALDLSGLGVRSLEVVRRLNLGVLDLRGTDVTDLSPLVGMQLEEFYAAPGTSDLGPLQVGAESLRVVDLRGALQVADLAPLAGAVNLEELWLDGTSVKDLEPLRGKPLKRLFVDLPGIKDFGVIESMQKLEELVLPRHAAGVPVAGLEALKKVRHPRFQSSGEIDGLKFKELSRKTDEAWHKWGDRLEQMAGPALGSDRVTVVEEVWIAPRGFPNAFDLDLRGLGVSDLSLLKDIPVNRLYLDTKSKPLDLRPLAGLRELKHLVLTGANVPSLQGVLDRKALESIVLSEETANVRRLHEHPSIKWAGYKFDESTRLPTTTVKQLFEGRDRKTAIPSHPDPGRQTEPAFLFDDPGMRGSEEVRKWKLLPPGDDGESARVWKPDPPQEGGWGGGYVQFFERKEDNQTSYFELPSDFRRKRRNLYGSSLGFELTAEGDGKPRKGLSDVVVWAGTNSLHYTFLGQNPATDWRRFQVILKDGPGWKVGSTSGDPATQEEMKSVLARVSSFQLRAEFYDGGTLEKTRLDNVVLWDPEETEHLVWNAMGEEKEKDDWISMESEGVQDLRAKLGLARASNDDNPHRVAVYQGRYGTMLVRPFSEQKPARLKLNPKAPTEGGTLLRFAARGAPSGSGISVRVVQDGVSLQEWPVGGDRWTEFSVDLPKGGGGKGEELCVLEVRPNGVIDPYCFVVGLELVPPSRRQQ